MQNIIYDNFYARRICGHISLSMDIEILSVNPLLNARAKVKFRSVQKKKDGTKLYLENEMVILEDYLYQQKTIEAYAILMDFQIGTRVGELVVLTKKDMLDNKTIFIR